MILAKNNTFLNVQKNTYNIALIVLCDMCVNYYG